MAEAPTESEASGRAPAKLAFAGISETLAEALNKHEALFGNLLFVENPHGSAFFLSGSS